MSQQKREAFFVSFGKVGGGEGMNYVPELN